MSRIKAAAFALLAAIALPASATVIENPGPLAGYYQIAYYSPLAQSFIAVDADLQSIGVNYFEMNFGFPNSPITIDLYEGAGTGGALLASRTFDLVNLTGFTDTDFSGVTLTPGHVYTAAATTSSPLEGIYITYDHYAGGDLISPQGGERPDFDLSFRVIGGKGTSAAPEPVSWAMMLGGFGLVGGAMRRRRAGTIRFG